MIMRKASNKFKKSVILNITERMIKYLINASLITKKQVAKTEDMASSDMNEIAMTEFSNVGVIHTSFVCLHI
jgi:hypothetical protein